MKSSLAIMSLFALLLMIGCDGKKAAQVSNVSSNKKVNINIVANRGSGLDPWKVEIKVKAYDFKEGYLAFEIYSDDINDKNVSFDWKDDRTCFITIQQRDGAPRKFQLIADSTQVQLAEV